MEEKHEEKFEHPLSSFAIWEFGWKGGEDETKHDATTMGNCLRGNTTRTDDSDLESAYRLIATDVLSNLHERGLVKSIGDGWYEAISTARLRRMGKTVEEFLEKTFRPSGFQFWRYNPKNYTINNSIVHYEIDLEEMMNRTQIFDTILHMGAKRWCQGEVLGDLVLTLDFLYGIYHDFNSIVPLEEGKVTVKEHLDKRWPKIKQELEEGE